MGIPKVIVMPTDSAGFQAIHLVTDTGALDPGGHIGYLSANGLDRVVLSASNPLPKDGEGKLKINS